MRLDRLLSNLKYGSRKEVQEIIKAGQITINGFKAHDYSQKVDPLKDVILINGVKLFYKDEIILAIYKPIGYLSANRDNIHPVVTDLIKPPYERHTFKIAGRLDLDAEGLIILTTNGNTVHLITNPNQKVLKVYEVTTLEPIDVNLLNRLLEPISVLDGNNNKYLATALAVEKIASNQALITIDSGKFHQVKRMFKAIGYDIINLKRIQIGKFKLPALQAGEYIEIQKEDVL